jgi:uncharacterized protein DUF6278
MSRRLSEFSRPDPGTGIARDYAIFFTGERGGAAALEEQLDAHLRQCSVLRQWASAQGEPLADAAPGLEALEGLLAKAAGNRPTPWRLRVEAGLFIGTVLVRNLSAAQWRLLPNGHPVVHLCGNTDLDVVALARARMETGAPDLRTVLPYAERLAQ